jgi:ABC-type multidrug transport system fused ATPase/permease subunit
LKLGLSYYSRVKGGNLLSYVNEQAQRCEQLTLYIGSIFSEILIIVSFLILLLSISGQLTLLAAVLLGFVAFGLKAIVQSVRVEGKIASQTIELFSSQVFELISGIRVIQAFTAEAHEKNRLSKTLKQRYQAERKSYAGQVAIQPISDTLGIFVLVILGFWGTQILSETLILPLLLTFLLILLRMFPRINQLNSLRTSLANFSESFSSISYFLQETKISDVPDGFLKFEALQNCITFGNVTFSHAGCPKSTLKGISFALPKGNTVALVGESGSGKSTLADLLLRFYDPQQGKVSIDGIDLKNFDLESLRRKISVVSQDTFLFNTTIRENICYGTPDAKESEVLAAARNAYAEEFILHLPDRFDTVIGDRGVRLSGGQRQRLAIARAILRNPEILVLDEATSALDSTSEGIVQKALDDVSQNKTVLVIAHRLSTIQRADQIIVLKQGEIVEAGRHQELISLGGHYYHMAKAQGMS